MTKSRKRSSSTSRGPSGGYRPPDRPFRSVASQMTAAHERAVLAGADAELRGEAAEALRLHRTVPMFRRSLHGDRLQLLAELGDDVPGWLVNRWLMVQAQRRMWTGADRAATNRALQLVVPLIYPGSIPFEPIGCAYPEQVLPTIAGRDWVVRQVDVHELGGLRRVVADHASAELLERADRVAAWCVAPMSACRVEALGPDAVTVTDLSTREPVELLDLGLGEQVGEGAHVLGRIVPTAAGPGAMFEGRPLVVDARAADAVAADPRSWLTTLARLSMAGRLPPAYSHQSESSLTADLPRRSWMSLVGVPMDEAPDHDPGEVVAEAVGAALALADRGSAAIAARRHVIGELVLDPSFDQRLRWRFVRPDLADAWRVLAEAVPDLAHPRCEELAMWCSATPDDLPDAIA